MTNKTSTEVTGYDLSSTGTLVEINCGTLLHLGWQLSAGSATDFTVEIQPEDSGNWYEINSYSGVSAIDDGVMAPEAFAVRLRNTATVADTADAVLGGSHD
jgi:hypothetical protein